MLSFEGELLALPLRDWNAAALAAAFGDDARACRGQTVTLSVDSINGYEFVAITPGQRTPARKVPAAKRTRPAKRR